MIKGVILAGGEGSRLMPLTKVTNKHLLPVGRKPMIFYSIEKMVESGVTEIMLVTGKDYCGDFVSLLGDGKEFGCNITYKVQMEPMGIAHALLLAENFVGDDNVLVILGDNIFQDSIEMKDFEQMSFGCKLFLKSVSSPNRFGVAKFDENDNLIAIVEKPKNYVSSLIVTGIYLYDSTVFSKIKKLKPSARGEYEITDVNNFFLADEDIRYQIFEGFWTDAGTFKSYAEANKVVETNLET